jgi:L-fuconolactonase
MALIRRDFSPEDLRRVSGDCGVDGFVTVQARQTLQETIWLLELAERESLIRGVVGWIPLSDPEIEPVIERFAASPRLKGIRHVVQDEPDDRFLLGEAFNHGVSLLSRHGVVYDILIYARHLPAAIEFVDRHPNQPFVLDHVAKPTIRGSQFDVDWERGFRELARRDHVTCKFSGLATEIRDDEWDVETIRPYWDVALEAFTPRRLMFGSDWPVCLVRTGYDRWLSAVGELAADLSEAERDDLFAGTATRVYQL